MRIMLLSGLIGLCSFAYGQTLIRTYYDEFPSIKKEEYHILNGDSSQVDGEYKMFSPSGKVITTGTFEKGLKQGTFTNYYEDGSIQRETIYQNDLREGLTQVFDAQGNIWDGVRTCHPPTAVHLVALASIAPWHLLWRNVSLYAIEACF